MHHGMLQTLIPGKVDAAVEPLVSMGMKGREKRSFHMSQIATVIT